MINLSKREQLSPASMIWIVKTSSNLGTDECQVGGRGADQEDHRQGE